MERLPVAVMVAAGIVFAVFACKASNMTDWPLAGPALYVVAGA